MSFLSHETKAALDAFVRPVWVIDAARGQMVWANRSALALFFSATVEELLESAPMRGASALLLDELLRLPAGARLETEFRVFRPASELTVLCTCTGIEGEHEGRLVLLEAHAERNAPASLRGGGADLEHRLQSRDRMASVGTLAAGLVHGINNPLSYVIANLEHIKRLLAAPPANLETAAASELTDVLEDSLNGAQRVRRIVADLASFSRPAATSSLAADLARAADRALDLAANEIRHRARIVREFSDIAAARGSESQLVQVILNVLINAAHAIEPGAIDRNAITLRTRQDHLGRPLLEIEDTGCGIAKENLARVFDPFFTTKPVGVGAGLGLSIAQRIVRELDGEICVESVHGLGTKVQLMLPAAPPWAIVEQPLHSVIPLSTQRGRARVLVVDDEPAILRAFRRVLFAHEVTMVSSGPEALKKIIEGPAFDAIFCDVMMPEMSGVEVYQRIRARGMGEERHLVFMTGGAFAEPAAHFVGSVENPKLNKPFTGSAVRALVAMVSCPR